MQSSRLSNQLEKESLNNALLRSNRLRPRCKKVYETSRSFNFCKLFSRSQLLIYLVSNNIFHTSSKARSIWQRPIQNQVENCSSILDVRLGSKYASVWNNKKLKVLVQEYGNTYHFYHHQLPSPWISFHNQQNLHCKQWYLHQRYCNQYDVIKFF